MDADCIIVGLRCAGAPLALALRRAGVRVVALERDELFTDQPFSTHAIQPYGMRLLDHLGLGDAVRGLAPRARGLRMQVEDAYMQLDLSDDARDARCPRRLKLDPYLLELFQLWVRVEVCDGERVVTLSQGLPQGSVSSNLR